MTGDCGISSGVVSKDNGIFVPTLKLFIMKQHKKMTEGKQGSIRRTPGEDLGGIKSLFVQGLSSSK